MAENPFAQYASTDNPFAQFAAPKTSRDKARADAKRRSKNTPSALRSFTQGAGFSFADELDAAGAAAETAITNLAGRVTGREGAGYSAKEAYDAVMESEKEADAAFSSKRPVTSGALKIAGAVTAPGAALAGRFVGGATSLGGAVGRSAGVGAGMGALAGAGSSEGGALNRARGAGKGAVVGGIVGGAVPLVARGAQTAGRAVDNATGGRIGSYLGGHEARAGQRIRDALRSDGVDDATIQRLTREWEATGAPPPMLMNVAGENTRRLVRLAGMKGEDAANQLGGMGERARANMPGQARARVRELTPGETRSGPDVVAAATAARGRAANRNYAGPYREQVQIGDDVADVLTDAPGKSALRAARADALERRAMDQVDEIDRLLAAEPRPADPFEWYRPTPPTASGATLDRTRIATGERAGKLARAGNNARASGAMGRRDTIDSALDQVPGLQNARGNFRTYSQFIEGAEDIGPSALTAPADDFAPQFEAIPQSALSPAREGAKIGARQAMSDSFGKTPSAARNTMDKVADAEDVQRNLRSLFGDEADRFVAAIRNIRKGVKDAQFVDPNVGSKTAPSQADAEAANDVLQVLQGRGLGVLLTKLRRGLTLTDQEAAIIADIATSQPTSALSRLRPTPAQVGRSALAGQAGRAAPVVAGQTQGQREPAMEYR